MRRSCEYPTEHQYGPDYYPHVHKVPHYPQGQAFLNNCADSREDSVHYEHQQQQFNHGNYGGYYEHQQRQRVPEVHKSFEVTERVTQYDRNGNRVVFEETVDVEADGYIQEKHNGFESCMGNSTFRAR